MAQTLNKKIIISKLVEDITITLLCFGILSTSNKSKNGFVLFNKRLEEYWNGRVRGYPKDFHYIK